MIVVTVEVPIMEKSYEFQIDEDVPFHIVRDEIADMISRRNQCPVNGDISEMMLWDKRRRIQVDMNLTGFENGLETGSELVIA